MLLVRLKSHGRVAVILLFLLFAALSVFKLRAGYQPPAWLSGGPQKELLLPISNRPAEALQLNATLLETASQFTAAILNIENKQLPRLQCVSPETSRYSYLQQPGANNITSLPKYLFALNLHQATPVLPSLMGAIVETIKFLGYKNCALSVVEGRSTDGTLEILARLQDSLKDTGLRYTLQTSDVDPLAAGNNRIQSLAALRNLALQPFVSQPQHFAANASIVFVNDVVLCAEDILELIYQRQNQAAEMTCAMDWEYLGADPTFYDVWVARGMTGDSFFRIPEDGNWNSAWNLFWNDDETRDRLNAGLPFQVFSCWNGITAFTAEPLFRKQIALRPANSKECFQGEPKLFCKDLWAHGYGRIAVIPSVNVAYTVEQAEKIKALKGYVNTRASAENDEKRVAWKTDPPALVKCMPGYDHQPFLPWNEGIGT